MAPLRLHAPPAVHVPRLSSSQVRSIGSACAADSPAYSKQSLAFLRWHAPLSAPPQTLVFPEPPAPVEPPLPPAPAGSRVPLLQPAKSSRATSASFEVMPAAYYGNVMG